MKPHSLLLAAALACLLPSCATFNTGDGPNARPEEIQQGVTPRRDITFSVDFTDDYVVSAEYDKEDIILAIRKDFEKSGLFSRVHYVRPEEASPYHLHFRVGSSGTDAETRIGLFILSAWSCTIVPTWSHYSLDWSMSVILHGKEVHSFSSQQQYTNVIWFPTILAAPFRNRFLVRGDLLHDATNYFLKEIQQNRFNETLSTR